MITKYLDENNFFFARFRSNVGSGDSPIGLRIASTFRCSCPGMLSSHLDASTVTGKAMPTFITSVMGDNEGGIWKDQTLDGFNFQKSFGMLDAELLIGRNDDMISDHYTYYTMDGVVLVENTDDNAFMEYALRLQANFSENFLLRSHGLPISTLIMLK